VARERFDVRSVFRNLNSWSEFRANLDTFDPKAKGDAFELLVKLHLTLDPKYRTQLQHVWNVREVPREIAERLRLPAQDEGIDLVAETTDGAYWAVQCKYRHDEDHSLNVRELATFTSLCFGHCRGFELGLVCTTADRFSHRLTKYTERLAFQAGDVWRSLGQGFFKAARAALAGRVPQLSAKDPRPHQRVAIQRATRYFDAKKNSRGKLIMPCGTGKSLTAFWIAERLRARKILVAVPSIALVRQTLDVWSKEFLARGVRPRWIAVCSDESVGDVRSDAVAVLVQDLGVRVHTDPVEVKSWLALHRDRDVTVVFTTYQSGRAAAAAARTAGFVFDLGIMDEAHRTVGRHDSPFAHLLHDHNVRIKRRVFMTATERYFKGSGPRDGIASMDAPELYGAAFHQLSFKKAIEQRPAILSDYTVLTVVVNRRDIRRLIEDRRFVRPKGEGWNVDTEARTFAAAIALRRAMAEHPIQHTVTFHSKVKRAREFAAVQAQLAAGIPGTTDAAVFHVSGAMPTSVRERHLAAFLRARRAVVTNARCLTEGVDLPMIDGVLFADPRQSRIDIVQAVGRALRPAPGKDRGYVVVPVLLDDGARGESATESAYHQIIDVLGALAANDERIVEYLRVITQGKKWQGPPIIEADLPVGIEIDAAEFARAVELRVWKRLAQLSWRGFPEARAYVRQLGLRSQQEWFAWARSKHRPADIPSDPYAVYRNDGWLGLGDWLGTGSVATRDREYRTFEHARVFVRALGLRNQAEWIAYTKSGRKPDDIPATPNAVYAEGGWLGFGDWLGTGRRRERWRSFAEARRFARKLGLTTVAEWTRFASSPDRPPDIPVTPWQVYAKAGWIGIGDWLGTGRAYKQGWRGFAEARAFVRGLRLKNNREWREYAASDRRPGDIPASPERIYAGSGWAGYGDWLGSGRLRTYGWRTFESARDFARKLGLRSLEEWRAFAASSAKPNDIPAAPWRTYRAIGWVGIADWLGVRRRPRGEGWRSYGDAQAFVATLGLSTVAEWREYAKSDARPVDIPTNPNTAYHGCGWTDWPGWLGAARASGSRRPRAA
jgi:superfamily II DNA or RNA helicase